MIDVGQPFPEFELKNQSGEVVTRNSLIGQPTVVYFYPKDDTTGCTAEACSFRDRMPEFGSARVFGVSPDSVKSHEKFIAKYNLNFTLLADPDHSLAQALGIWVKKSMYGREYMGIERTTYLLDANAVIQKVWRKVKPTDHALDVIKALVG